MSKWLIAVEQLAQCYQRDNVIMVDCRFSLADTDQGQRLYSAGHIPGAYYLHLDRDLSGQKSRHGGRHPLPDSEEFITTLQRLGINRDSLVVAYDDSGFAFASRLLWLLRYFGHENVKVLDGGYQAWCDAGLASVTELPEPRAKGNISAQLQPDMVVDINQVKTIPLLPDAVLIDCRERERFLGLSEPIDPVAGYINGAVNYPWTDTTDGGGFFTTGRQQQRWTEQMDKDELVLYCGSGVTACVNLLSLAEIGREDAKLYAGSWSDWCSYLELSQ